MKYQIQYISIKKKRKEPYELTLVETYEIERAVKWLEKLGKRKNIVSILITKFRDSVIFFDKRTEFTISELEKCCPKFRFLKDYRVLEIFREGNVELVEKELNDKNENYTINYNIKNEEAARMFEEAERKLVRYIPNSSDISKN